MTPQNGWYRVWENEDIGWVFGQRVSILAEYKRADYPHWVDTDGDCQHTRNEVLVAEATAVTLTGTGCAVSTGTWNDPYSGQPITGNARQLDVDHMIPLGYAHRAGA